MTVKEIMEQAKDGSISWEDIKKREGLDTEMEKLEKMVLKLEDDTISRQAALDVILPYCPDDDGTCSKSGDDLRNLLDDIENLPPAQPERIQNNAVHLCDSCKYTYMTCPSHGNDAVFGDGKGNDNICACNKYRPISAQPEREKGEWIPVHPLQSDDGGAYMCSKCKTGMWEIRPSVYHYCPNCGKPMKRGKQDE